MNDEYANPIIVKIESQRVIGYQFPRGGGHITELENVGVDAVGNRWRWRNEIHTDNRGMGWIGSGYSYTKL